MNEINTTPLVDVTLVLLVIFLITAPLINQAVPVNLPQADSNPSDQKESIIQLSIQEDGSFFVDKDKVELDLLSTTLSERSKKFTTDVEIHLKADKNVRYEYVAKAIAATNRAMLSKIAFVTEPE
jgi:biopolymer transport protein ExbD